MKRSAPLLVVVALVAAGCLSDWHKSPVPSLDDLIATVPWFSVMHRGIAIQPYKMPRHPAEGAVPLTGSDVVPVPIEPNRAALDRLRNPIPNTAASLERGRERYDIYCGVCHGDTGAADGAVARALGGTVRDLTILRMRQISDGWIYAVIGNGYGLMPEYKSKLSPEDRWNIVNYVRVLQGVAQ